MNIEVQNGVPNSQVSEVVIFPFDDYTVPFSKGLLLNLIHGVRKPGDEFEGAGFDPNHPGEPVVRVGEPGTSDSKEVIWPTVIKVGSEYRMWYVCRGDSDHDAADSWEHPKIDSRRKLGFAVSTDGIKWEKPNLGLVEYNGNKNNNLIDSPGGNAVVYDPDDADPERRFKMIGQGEGFALTAYYSADGLSWKPSPHNPVGGPCETWIAPIKFNGCWYVNGQGGPSPMNKPIPHPYVWAAKREIITYASYDFDHWAMGAAASFRRENFPPRIPTDFEWHRGEQVHEGAAMWNRGNVILGFYGQYHNRTNDRKYATQDIGLLTSHDAVHFREPVPDFKLIPCFEEQYSQGEWDGAKLMQSPAIENIGDRTIKYYSTWEYPTRGMIRVATWERDRIGYFSPISAPMFQGRAYKWVPIDPHFISCPLKLNSPKAQVHVNADGLGQHSQLKVELLDLEFRPVPGYSGEQCIPIKEDGLRQLVTWQNKDSLIQFNHPIRVRVKWEGVRPEDANLFAVYVG